MKIHYLFLLFLLFISITSFKPKSEELLGIWTVNPRTGLYELVKKEPSNKVYFIFKEDGILEFHPSHKVYLPPEGKGAKCTWKQSSDSTLQLEYYSYIGMVSCEWKLKQPSKYKLRYIVTSCSSDYE